MHRVSLDRTGRALGWKVIVVLVALGLLATMIALAAPSHAAHPGTTVFVDASNPDCAAADGSAGAPFCTIQEGVNHAIAGDTIEVAAGVYDSEPTTGPLGSREVRIPRNDLTLLGAKAGIPAGPAANPVDRGSDESILMGSFRFTADRHGTVIDGFTVQSGTFHGINALRGLGNIVVNNIFEGTPHTALQAGILVQGVREHYIAHNNIQGYRQGMNIDGGSAGLNPSVIENNYLANTTLSTIFFNASTTNGHIIRGNVLDSNNIGIFVTQGEHLIQGNTVMNGTSTAIAVLPAGTGVGRTHDLVITENVLIDNFRAISFGAGSHADDIDNVATMNCIEGNVEGLRNSHDNVLNARDNWWGASSGPSGVGPGTGDSVFGNVDFDPWLMARPAFCPPLPSPNEVKQAVIDDLQAMLPSGDAKVDSHLTKAINSLNTSLTPEWWDGEDRLDPGTGGRVFDHEKAAIKELMALLKLPGDPGVAPLIQDILDADRALAETAIADAVAAGGDPKSLNTANAELAKADEAIAKGKPSDAVDNFKKAWENAQKAMK